MQNVGQELIVIMEIFMKKIFSKINNLETFYDYEGISNWATGGWNMEKDGTIFYSDFI